jgi:hypothetical protein
MLGKLTSIDAVERWMKRHDPEHPFCTVYHGFQTVTKKPSDIAYRNEKEANLEQSIKNLKQFLIDHSTHGGQFTIFAKTTGEKQDTTGKTEYVELLPQGMFPYSQHAALAGTGYPPSVPQVFESDIQSKISGAVNAALTGYKKDLAIQGLQARIQELENEEPDGFDWSGAVVGLGELLITKIPEASIGKIFENLFSKAEGETVDKLANMGNMYMQMQMQKQAAAQAAAAQRKQQPSNESYDDENEIEYV